MRYIGNSLYRPIPMYYLLGIGATYIGMGIELSIPMYRLLKLGPPYIGMALNRAFPMYVLKPYIPDTSGCPKNIRFRCIAQKNTSELQKIRQSRCIHPSKSIKISNPRCHILPSEANLRANHSEPRPTSLLTLFPIGCILTLLIQYN